MQFNLKEDGTLDGLEDGGDGPKLFSGTWTLQEDQKILIQAENYNDVYLQIVEEDGVTVFIMESAGGIFTFALMEEAAEKDAAE